MSIQRARVNCRACHQIMSVFGEYKLGDECLAKRDVSKDGLYYRNQAMSALEQSDQNPNGPAGSSVEMDAANEGLMVCESCDYSSPRVVAVTEDYIKRYNQNVEAVKAKGRK